jgi:hypothetical protein
MGVSLQSLFGVAALLPGEGSDTESSFGLLNSAIEFPGSFGLIRDFA